MIRLSKITKQLCNLHNIVVDTFNKYHQRPLERASNTLETLKPKIEAQDENALKMAQQIKIYGVSGIKESYNPHTTLWYQWPTNPILNSAVESVKHETNELSCDGWALILGKLGFNGNIESPYAVFPLGQETNMDEAVKLAAETHCDC